MKHAILFVNVEEGNKKINEVGSVELDLLIFSTILDKLTYHLSDWILQKLVNIFRLGELYKSYLKEPYLISELNIEVNKGQFEKIIREGERIGKIIVPKEGEKYLCTIRFIC